MSTQNEYTEAQTGTALRQDADRRLAADGIPEEQRQAVIDLQYGWRETEQEVLLRRLNERFRGTR